MLLNHSYFHADFILRRLSWPKILTNFSHNLVTSRSYNIWTSINFDLKNSQDVKGWQRSIGWVWLCISYVIKGACNLHIQNTYSSILLWDTELGFEILIFLHWNKQENVFVFLQAHILAPGRFAQKPVPPGTVRAKKKFRTGRFLPGRFAHFSKNWFQGFIYQNLSIKCNGYVKLIMDILEIYFLSLIFPSNMFSSYFFPKLRGRFTHGTVRANVFFSDNFNVFFKEGTKNPNY